MPALREVAARRRSAGWSRLVLEIRTFPRDMMVASYDLAFDLYEEEAARKPKFRKISESWKPFRDEQYLWFRIAENTFDNSCSPSRRRKNAKPV
jgi:TRAP-type mannitol/chloroaromatic compound transport system substrate-binding protein